MLKLSCSINDFNKWVLKDMYICSRATKVIEFHFKILSQGISDFYSMEREREHLLIHSYKTNHRKKNEAG
jgi:hypothetical protein